MRSSLGRRSSREGPDLGQRTATLIGTFGDRHLFGTITHLFTLAAGFAVLLYANQNQWFFGDEWDFLTDRGLIDPDRGLLSPHNEHWSTIPILIYRGIFSIVGIRSYVPYISILLLLHLGSAHLLWRIARQIGVSGPVATVATTVFVFLGSGSENLLWAFQMGFVGSVLLGLLQSLCIMSSKQGATSAWAITLGVVNLMVSAIAIPMIVVACLTAAMMNRRRLAIMTAAVPGAVYLVWFLLLGREGFTSDMGLSFSSINGLPAYVWTGIQGSLDATSGLAGTAPLVVLVVIAAGFVQRRHLAENPITLAAAGGALALFLLTGAGRLELGIQQAASSRYTYIAVALLMPLLMLLLDRWAKTGNIGTGFALFLSTAVLVHGVYLLRQQARAEADRETTLKTQILAAASIARSGEPILELVPEPSYNPDLQVHELLEMADDGQLPRIQVRDVDRLTAASRIQVSLTTMPDARTATGMGPRILLAQRANVAEVGGGCISVSPTGAEPQIVLHYDGPASLELSAQADGELTVFLRRSDSSVLAPPRSLILTSGVAQFLNVGISDIEPILTLPQGGLTTVCGLGSTAGSQT